MESFNHLYDRIALDLEPPMVVLDKTRTFDGQPVMATFGPSPAASESIFSDFFTLTSRNIGLRAVDVKPGDQVRYFARQGDDEFVSDVGEADLQAVEMTVDHVVDDQHLIVIEKFPFAGQEESFEIEIWRDNDDRVLDIHSSLSQYAEYATPPLAWQPAPDEGALDDARSSLNQWMRHNYRDETRPRPKLLDSLPEPVKESPPLKQFISAEGLAEVAFSEEEARRIQEAIWLRDISRWARGAAVSDLELATALFDWTVRHIQLESADTAETAHHQARNPWEILLFGVGTAQQRAWVFTHLCRQQGLPAVVLAVQPSTPGEAPEPRFWCTAVVSDRELYLFDPELGLPIPSPDGDSVASLTEAATDPNTLRQLDLGEQQPYLWALEDIRRVVALVETSPLSLSRRAVLLQEELIGEASFVLAADPTLLAEDVAQHEHIADVRVWSWPFRTLDHKLEMGIREGRNATEFKRQRIRAARDFRPFALVPHLWKARALHFHGPAPTSVMSPEKEDASAMVDGHKDAIGLYLAARAADREMDAEQSGEKRQSMGRAKEDATYWLGLLKIDQGDHQIAVTSWLPQVVAAEPPSRWLGGARYNLARSYESLGQIADALEIYEKDDSPQQHGNRLRARWLREGRFSTTQSAGS